jgi:twitching motility protein PilT
MTIDEILVSAVEKGISDIHIAADSCVYFRFHGELEPMGEEKFGNEAVAKMLRHITTDAQYSVFEEERQLDSAYEIEGVSRFRLNAYYQMDSISLVFRAITTTPPTMKDINLPDIFKKFIGYKSGLVLITGATGSGKSTTMAAMVEELNRTSKKKIITLEDPIEYIYENKQSLVTQREVGRDVKTFAAGLKAILRQDPDVIIAGELRDQETIDIALKAAETGHLVIATLHTNSAVATIDRISGEYPAAAQEVVLTKLSKSLKAVASQYLVPKIGGGRCLAAEIMVNTRGISNQIKQNNMTQIPMLIQTGSREGMILMQDTLRHLKQQGVITQDTLEKYTPKN